MSSELPILRQPDLMIHHYKPERLRKKKEDYCIQGQGHSEGLKTSMLVQMVSSRPPNIVTKFGIVMHHHEPHTKRLVCYFQGQGHSKG